jgi:hypothetical protein
LLVVAGVVEMQTLPEAVVVGLAALELAQAYL